MDIREVSEKLSDQALGVARYLLPAGVERNREWQVGSIQGEAGKSLSVCVSGSKRGLWSDFATGEKGDLLELWRLVRGVSLADAIKEAKDWMGIVEPSHLESFSKKTYSRPKPPPTAKKLIAESQVMKYLTTDRCLTRETLDTYRIGEAKEIGPYESWSKQSPWKGPWIVLPSFRGKELIACKFLHVERVDGKKQTFVEANCEPCLFGWQAIDDNAREVVICEGEIDAATFYQYGFPALSVPFGGGGKNKQQWIDYEMLNLERFEVINIAMDNDEVGNEAVEEILNRLGVHRCRVVKLPHKDVNECLQKGVPKEKIVECIKSAEFKKPEELVSFNVLKSGIVEEFYPKDGIKSGFASPWKKFPFRWLRSEVSIYTGINGHGKSIVLDYIMIAAAEQGEKICIASLEVPTKKTGQHLVRQKTGQHKPDHTEICECLMWMEGKFWSFNLVGTAKVDRLLETFRFAYKRFGVKQFVIDSLMKCGIADDDYNGQKAFLEKLCDFVNTTEAHVHLVAHARKKENEEGILGKLDIKGNGAIADLAWNCFTIWRNKRKEAALEEFKETGEITVMTGIGKKSRPLTYDELKALPDAIMSCDKNRSEGWEGKVRLWYDWGSMRFFDNFGLVGPCYDEQEGDENCPY